MTHTEPRLKVHLFGVPEVTAQTAPVVITRGQIRALLYRLVAADEPLARDYLAFLFWPDVDDSTARQNLSVALSHLRRALPDGSMLNATKDAVALVGDGIWSDVKTFASVCLSGESRSQHLREAVALYRGRFLDGVFLSNCPEFEAWQIAERQRYEQIYLNTLKRLMIEATAYGNYAEAIAYAQQYLDCDPAEEEIHRRLMELYLASGDRSAAMRQYETCVTALERELGVPPMDETRAIYEAALEKRRSNLPVPPTRLIGREAEMALTTQLLRQEDVWLVTLNGPGGSGKTRLALEAAIQVQAHFLHGVYFVDLAPVQDYREVVRTIFRALGMEDKSGIDHLQVLSRFLRERRLLLVLDNFEQVVDAARDLVTLHSHAPGLKLLVTSRVSLHVRGEREAPVPPLALPADVEHADVAQLSRSAAVQLFTERVQAVRPSFHLDEMNAETAARICIALDGLPLAIELAAARCKLFTPQILYERLHEPLTLLSHGAHDLPKRQQTLRATMTWSVGLLSLEEQKLFRRLGVFRGSFSFESAESVCSIDGDLKLDILDGIESLLDHNLVRPVAQADADEPRFTILEIVRSFALEQLEAQGELSAIQYRYAAYFVSLADKAYPQLMSLNQITWIKRLDRDLANFREALDWILKQRYTEMAYHICVGLSSYWLYQQPGDALYFEKVLQLEPDDKHSIYWAWTIVDAFETASRRDFSNLQEALTIFRDHGDVDGQAITLLYLSNEPARRGDIEETKRLIDEAQSLLKRSESQHFRAIGVGMRTHVLSMQGEHDAADDLLRTQLQILREVGGPLFSLQALLRLDQSASMRGDFELARAYVEEALGVLQVVNPGWLKVTALEDLGQIEWQEGNYEKARQYIEEADELYMVLHGRHHSHLLLMLGNVEQSLERYDTAIELYERSLAIRREKEWSLSVADTLTYLCDALYYVGQVSQALAYLKECLNLFLALSEEGGLYEPFTSVAFAVAAKFEARRGNLLVAVKLHSAAENLYRPVRMPGVQLPLPHIEDYLTLMAALHAQLDEATYAQAWAEGTAMSMHDALVFALSLYET